MVKTIVRANPGVLVLEKGTVVNKAHWNDIEDLELVDLPETEREVVIVDDGTVHIIDERIASKTEVDSLQQDKITEVYVYKDEAAVENKLDSINKVTGKNYTSIIKVILKKETE